MKKITRKSPGILTVIKACRRKWLGHVRLEGGRIIKELLLRQTRKWKRKEKT
jgi:hypothetical protein